MAYRDPSDPSQDSEESDPEAVAIAVLRSRAWRLRNAIHAPIMLLGLGAGIAAYVVLREWQFARNGAHVPWLTAVMSFVPTFGASLRLAPRLANVAVGRLLPRWRAALAKEHGLDLVELTETTRLLE